MRPIDADALHAVIENELNKLGPFGEDMWKGLSNGLAYIEEAPTIEAVPVVRCKDCKHYTQTVEQGFFSWEVPQGICRNNRYFTAWQEERCIVPCNHFCADGERKTE